MKRHSSENFLTGLRTLFAEGACAGLTDAQLLERFLAGRDGWAFERLVERHGLMVLRACQGILRDEHDAMDAFQATFLILVRKGGSLWVQDSLGPWLHRVACRAARRAKVDATRRQTLGRQLSERAATYRREAGGGDLNADLHEEIDRLPQRYRVPLVLCDLEGCTYAEASRQLGWSIGTVKSRLAEARRRLRLRLARGGQAPAIAAGRAGEAGATTEALPAGLARVTGQAARRFAAGTTATGAIPVAVAKLTEGVLKSMAVSTLSKSAAVLMLLASLGLGMAELVNQIQAADQAKPEVAAQAETRARQKHAAVSVVRENAPSPVFSDLPSDLAEKIRAIPGVRVVAPEVWKVSLNLEGKTLFSRALEKRQHAILNPPIIQGQEIEAHLRLKSAIFADALKDGRFLQPIDKDQPHVVISRQLAREYPLDGRPRRVGDPLQIGSRPFKIIGIYETGSSLQDSVIVMDIGSARTLMSIPAEVVSSYHVEAEDPNRNDQVAAAIEEAIPGIDVRPVGAASR